MYKTVKTGQLGGMPVTQKTVQHMQDSYIGAIGAIARAFGSRVIVSGVADNGGSWGDGWIVVDGELMPFYGGLKANYLVIQTTFEERQFQDGVQRPMYYNKFAQCGITGDILFSSLVRIDTWADISRNLSNLITAHNELRVEFDAHTHSWDEITGKPAFDYPLYKGKFLIGDSNGSDTIRTVTFPSVGTTNYTVLYSVVSLGADWNNDNDVIAMLRNFQASSFQILLREVASNVQNLRFDYRIYPA